MSEQTSMFPKPKKSKPAKARVIHAPTYARTSTGFVLTISGLRLVSEANTRGRNPHVKNGRNRDQQKTMRNCLSAMVGAEARHACEERKLTVTFTRIGPKLLDSDNLVGSAKHVRDAFAKWACRGDGPKDGITWHVLGEVGPYATRLEVSW